MVCPACSLQIANSDLPYQNVYVCTYAKMISKLNVNLSNNWKFLSEGILIRIVLIQIRITRVNLRNPLVIDASGKCFKHDASKQQI